MTHPPRRWQAEPSAHRICQASALLMKLVRQLTAWGLSRHETVLALQSVIDALHAGGRSVETFLREREER